MQGIPVSKVLLSFSAHDVKAKDFFSSPSCRIVLFQQEIDHSWSRCGQTEVVADYKEPKFVQQLSVYFYPTLPKTFKQLFRAVVYQVQSSSKTTTKSDKFLGQYQFNLTELITIKAETVKLHGEDNEPLKYGSLTITAIPILEQLRQLIPEYPQHAKPRVLRDRQSRGRRAPASQDDQYYTRQQTLHDQVAELLKPLPPTVVINTESNATSPVRSISGPDPLTIPPKTPTLFQPPPTPKPSTNSRPTIDPAVALELNAMVPPDSHLPQRCLVQFDCINIDTNENIVLQILRADEPIMIYQTAVRSQKHPYFYIPIVDPETDELTTPSHGLNKNNSNLTASHRPMKDRAAPRVSNINPNIVPLEFEPFQLDLAALRAKIPEPVQTADLVTQARRPRKFSLMGSKSRGLALPSQHETLSILSPRPEGLEDEEDDTNSGETASGEVEENSISIEQQPVKLELTASHSSRNNDTQQYPELTTTPQPDSVPGMNDDCVIRLVRFKGNNTNETHTYSQVRVPIAVFYKTSHRSNPITPSNPLIFTLYNKNRSKEKGEVRINFLNPNYNFDFKDFLISESIRPSFSIAIDFSGNPTKGYSTVESGHYIKPKPKPTININAGTSSLPSFVMSSGDNAMRNAIDAGGDDGGLSDEVIDIDAMNWGLNEVVTCLEEVVRPIITHLCAQPPGTVPIHAVGFAGKYDDGERCDEPYTFFPLSLSEEVPCAIGIDDLVDLYKEARMLMVPPTFSHCVSHALNAMTSWFSYSTPSPFVHIGELPIGYISSHIPHTAPNQLSTQFRGNTVKSIAHLTRTNQTDDEDSLSQSSQTFAVNPFGFCSKHITLAAAHPSASATIPSSAQPCQLSCLGYHPPFHIAFIITNASSTFKNSQAIIDTIYRSRSTLRIPVAYVILTPKTTRPSHFAQFENIDPHLHPMGPYVQDGPNSSSHGGDFLPPNALSVVHWRNGHNAVMEVWDSINQQAMQYYASTSDFPRILSEDYLHNQSRKTLKPNTSRCDLSTTRYTTLTAAEVAAFSGTQEMRHRSRSRGSSRTRGGHAHDPMTVFATSTVPVITEPIQQPMDNVPQRAESPPPAMMSGYQEDDSHYDGVEFSVVRSSNIAKDGRSNIDGDGNTTIASNRDRQHRRGSLSSTNSSLHDLYDYNLGKHRNHSHLFPNTSPETAPMQTSASFSSARPAQLTSLTDQMASIFGRRDDTSESKRDEH